MNILINADLVRHLVSTQFPKWGNLPIKPMEFDGWDNRTFHLGKEMSVRLPSAVGYSPQAKKEQHWLPIFAPQLPIQIPRILAHGIPDDQFPWHWGIYHWIEGENAGVIQVENMSAFAKALAHFVKSIQQIDTTNGPLAGAHNAFRGCPLMVYDNETRKALKELDHKIDTITALQIWEHALAATYKGPPVWFHGDIAPGNLIVKDDSLSAVIDFGCCGVGDPACDLAIAWTYFFSENRQLFKKEVAADDETWSRGRGWALWKALITLEEYRTATDEKKMNSASNTINEIMNDYLQNG
jgi:aminoglycoside phosphotransferase (APT) family kinase protein